MPRKASQLIKADPEKFKDVTATLVAAGRTPAEIAKALYPDDPKGRKKIRREVNRMAAFDTEFETRIAARAHGKMVLAMGRVTDALIRRAERGRPDAIKLLYEASGFYNPRVKHDHSGNVTVTIQGIPRPPSKPEKVEALAEQSEPTVVDAEVVEDEDPTGEEKPAKTKDAA